MKKTLLPFILLLSFLSFSQTNDPYIQALIEQYSDSLELNCDVYIELDVEGIIIPPKTVNLRFENGEPQISGQGIAMLPKKGIVNQFNDLLQEEFQAIYLSKRGTNRVYKLVSLDDTSDWITADVEFDENLLLVTEATINTRKFGSFNVKNSYANGKYPDKTEINFNLKKFKLPLKFLGRSDPSFSKIEGQEITEGKVYLSYTYLD
ncbi:hypothetical protein [Winogradskyella aurantiaca]|uniref:hypothetical protein n=1 Tax=Winogradskyella aurantiaca TaxID=2219558 RepID=UPI000E1E16DD|nr:hypothetical protein [Winogradskyella aurantiaca]